MIKHIIQIQVYKGDSYYVAEGVNLPIVTQAKTLDELMYNIQEAVELHLAKEDLSEFNLIAQPAVLANFELPIKVHA
jgi:predicted RNase H-like HicB family nuclease